MILLSQKGNSRIEVKQSVFIGRAVRVDTPEEANDFVKMQRSTYPDARHTVYAWKISGDINMQKYSDDGEPSGTAGMPVLSLLEHGGITNAAVAVTRYFGGILLGKGGLVRAYSECAKAALNDASPASYVTGKETYVTIPYNLADKVMFELKNLPCEIKDTTYLQDVRILVASASDMTEELMSRLTDITGGGALFEDGDNTMIRGEAVLL